jgi:hypothetical protein
MRVKSYVIKRNVEKVWGARYLPKNSVQWNLDLSFFKGVAKTNDEYGETINPENHFF